MPEDVIQARLLAPSRQVGLAALLPLWSRTRISVRLALPRDLADFGLGTRVRGALGHALLRAASPEAIAGRPCSWVPACALDPLFVERASPRGGPWPKPVVPRIIREGDTALVTLDLFGFAANWAEPVADALVAALRGGLRDRHGALCRLDPRERRIEDVPAPVPLPPAMAYALTFSTPLVLRQGEAPQLSAAALVMGLLTRLEGLARWHDLDLMLDWSAVRAMVNAMELATPGARLVRWNRASARQGREIPMAGWVGPILLTGEAELLGLLLVLGETAGAGGFTSAGHGQFRAIPLVGSD
jgi:hypothetical protein